MPDGFPGLKAIGAALETVEADLKDMEGDVKQVQRSTIEKPAKPKFGNKRNEAMRYKKFLADAKHFAKEE